MTMTRALRCADVMADCPALIEGRDNAEVMAQLVAHLRRDHGLKTPLFEMVTRAHTSIRDRSEIGPK